MARRLEEIYIITSERDYLPFFNRYLGDYGRDIAAVKLALGGVYSSTIDGEQPVDNSIGKSWFECGSNQPISEDKLKKFDKKLRLDLMAFQLKHQFVLISYYFEKYCVFEASTNEELTSKVSAAASLFDSEFGTIGEGTIALLHGWRPNSAPYNHSFVTDTTDIKDEIPEQLYEMLKQGTIEKPPTSIVEAFLLPEFPEYATARSTFNTNSHAGKRFFARIPDVKDPVYASYTSTAVGADMKESVLYTSAREIMESGLRREVSELSSGDRNRILSPMLEPDYLTDPSPFPVGGDTIGFFDRTEYTLENLPDFSDTNGPHIRELEEAAITKILRYYNKPLIWNLTQDLNQNDTVSFAENANTDLENNGYSVTTIDVVREYSLSPEEYQARYVSNLESINGNRIINFINFRTPSLRPGDVYRAYFEVPKEFLDKIESGIFEQELRSRQQTEVDPTQQQFDAAEENLSAEYCVENSMTEEEAKAKREKYKAFAMKKKLEISRKIRNQALIAAAGTSGNIDIDLGVFGNIPLANLLDDTSLDLQDLAETGIDAAQAGITGLFDVDLEDMNEIDTVSLGFTSLEERLNRLVETMKDDAVIKEVQKFKIKDTGQRLDLNKEADLLAQIIPEIKSLMNNNDNFREVIKKSEFTIEQILADDKRMVFGQRSDGVGGTKLQIRFTEFKPNMPSRVESIEVRNKKYFPSENGRFFHINTNEELTGALSEFRTINYLKNIDNLVPNLGPRSSVSAGCGTTGPKTEAALILKYTINNTGPLQFEKENTPYNPFHNWRDDLLEREETKRIADAWEKVKESEIFFGTDVPVPSIAPECDLNELYQYFWNVFDPAKLLCDLVSCLGLPNINVKLPNFIMPEIPEIKIFQYPNLTLKKTAEIIDALVTQMLCAFIRGILDILSSPFCQQQITRGLYGAASNVSPEIQAAFASALVDTGVPKEKNSNVARLIDDVTKFLTPRELCALLNGNPVNRQTYNIIQNLAKNYDLGTELNSKEKVITFFESVGIYIPEDLCSRLSQTDNLLGVENCQDTANILMQIRTAAMQGDVPPERVQQAVELAEKALLDKSRAYQLLMGDFSLEDMMPELDTNDVRVNPALQESAKIAVDSALSIVKRSFISSMSSYTPAMFLNLTSLVSIDDPEYDPVATMRFLRAVNNLQTVSGFNIAGRTFESQGLTYHLRRTLLKLCDDYEKIEYNGFQIYRSQLYPPAEEALSTPEQIENASRPENQTSQNGDPVNIYDSISTTLKGSLWLGDISEEGRAAGLSSLVGEDASLSPEFLADCTLKPEFQDIFEYLFPLALEVPSEEDATKVDTIIISSWPAFQNSESRARGDQGPEFLQGTDEYSYSYSNIALNVSYLKAITAVIKRLQTDIELTMEKVFKVVSREKLFEVIRDFYDIDLEASREESDGRQLIKTELTTSGQNIILEHPSENVGMTTTMFDTTIDQNTLRGETVIDDSFFFGTPQNPKNTILVCEEVPEQYKDFFEQGQANPLRRKVFKQQIEDIARELYNNYRLPDMQPFDIVADSLLLRDAQSRQYTETLEGTIEQMVSYMKESRLLNDLDYIQRLDSKVRSRSFIDVQEDNACIINPDNILSQGPIKFEELVSNFFPNQYMKELLDPVNSLYTQDYSKPGAFEKAMMTTALLGFIRVVCLDALMKGAIAYSTWDIDFVASDKLFFNYMCLLVENAITRETGFAENSILVDDAFYKVAGTNNRRFAIRKIINQELSGYISTLSKILFENDVSTDYYQWFLSKMQIVNAPYRRTVDFSEDGWVSELKESDINIFRKNTFTFLERYIRTSGRFEAVLGTPSELAVKQRDELYNLIRYYEDTPPYHHSFLMKLYNEQDPEFMAVPIHLDIPTKEEVDSFEIGAESSIREININGDTDSWPEKELWSLEDFNDILRAIFSNNIGVEKYIFHLLKKYHDPSDLNWHGRPKTLRKKLPVKAIKRRRTYYKIEEKDYFSAKLKEDFFPVVQGGDGASPQPRSRDSQLYHEWITDTPINQTSDARPIGSNTGGEASSPIGFNQKIEYNQRHYILTTNGENVFDQNNPLLDGLTVERKFDQDIENSSPSRGLTLSTKLPNGENVSPWSPDVINQETTSDDIIAGVNGSWAPEQIRGRNIFENRSGEVTEALYERFNELLGDNIEEEIWEEYVVDLVGQASPVFSQPGESGYNPREKLSTTAKELIADALNETLDYIREPGFDYDRRWAHVVTPFQNSEGHPTNVIETSQKYGPTDSTPVQAEISYPVRGIGYINSSDSIEGKGPLASGYAFFNNNIGVKYDSANQVYELDDNSKELLGENDYKIPLRLLITQIKDKQGNIKSCFVRYLIPEVCTFSQESANREAYLRTETEDSLRAYKSFIDNSLNKILLEDTPIAQQMRNLSWFSQAGLSEDRSDAYKEGSKRARLVNYAMGRHDGEGGGIGALPVLFRSKDNLLPNESSTGAQFVSIEKIWSRVGQREAEQKTGNFTIDDSPDQYTELDQFFEGSLGHLLRKEQSDGRGLSDIRSAIQTLFSAGDFSPLDVSDFESENTGLGGLAGAIEGLLGTQINSTDLAGEILPRRYLAYERASKHWFYQNSVADLVESNAANMGIKSIANLVSWFSQRRIDGFYGATSKDLKGNLFSKKGTTSGIVLEPTSEIYKVEAADYDCGPSLFYGDGRFLAEAFMVSLKQEIRDKLGTFPQSAQISSYKDALEAYRLQNAYKVNTTTFTNESVPEPPYTAYRPNLNEEYKDRIGYVDGVKRRKTLVTQYTDVKLSSWSLNYQASKVLDELSKPQENQSLSNIFNGYAHPDYYFSQRLSPTQILDSLSKSNVQVLNAVRGTKDAIFHNPNFNGLVLDRRFPQAGALPKSYSSIEDIISSIEVFSDEVLESSNIGSRFSREKIKETLDILSRQHDAALRWADNLLRAILNVMAGTNPEAISFLESLDIKHGVRLNLVLDHDIGGESTFKSDTAKYIQKLWNEDSQTGEEERAGRIFYEANLSENKQYEKYVSLPIASYERPLEALDICEPNSFITNIKEIIVSRDSSMIKSLSEEEKFRSFYEFSIPYRRVASLLTIHSTSLLAGYNTMPTVLTSTRSSLASIFQIMAQRNNFDASMGNTFGQNFNNVDLLNAMGQDFPAGGEPPNCFSLGGLNKDWFKMIQEMIEQFIYYFPAVIFRGIADQLDPAYKEMKSHYYACEIDTLQPSALGLRGGDDPTQFGLRGSQPGRKNYIPVNTGFPVDMAIGVTRLLRGDVGYLGKSINKLTSYIIGGPAQLLDPTFAFQIPCTESIQGEFRDWSKFEIGQYGRYGHPLSIFTLLALPTPMLPRDKEYKQAVCNRIDLNKRGIVPTVCSDNEE